MKKAFILLLCLICTGAYSQAIRPQRESANEAGKTQRTVRDYQVPGGQAPATPAPLRVLKTPGDSIYVRSTYSATQDVLTLIYLQAGINKITAWSYWLIPVATGDTKAEYEANDILVANSGDDAQPWNIDNLGGFVGGNHSFSVIRVTAAGHDKDAADIGSIWQDNSGSTKAVSTTTNATPIEVTTSTSHGYGTGDRVLISGITGNDAANGSWYITYVSTTKFTLDGSVGNGTHGGTPVLKRLNEYKLAKIDGNYLYFIGKKYYSATSNWIIPSAAVQSPFAHISGATHTTAITYSATTPLNAYQVSDSLTYSYLLDGTTSLTTGLHRCNYLQTIEQYSVPDPRTIVLDGTNFNKGATWFKVTTTHEFQDYGAQVTTTTFKNYTSLYPGNLGFIQAAPLNKGTWTKQYRYVPNAAPISNMALAADFVFANTATITLGSSTISITNCLYNTNVELVVGDFIRIEAAASAVTLQSPVYKVVSIAGDKTSFVVDRLVTNASGSYTAAGGGVTVVPASSGLAWDFRTIHNWTAVPGSGTMTFNRGYAGWEDKQYPINRVVEFQSGDDNVRNLGYACGFEPTSGIAENGYYATIANSMSFTGSATLDKKYFAGPYQARTTSQSSTATTYRRLFDPQQNSDLSACYWYKVGTSWRLYMEFHQNVTNYKVTLPSILANKAINIIDKHPAVTLIDYSSVTDGGIIVTADLTGYQNAYVILKLSETLQPAVRSFGQIQINRGFNNVVPVNFTCDSIRLYNSSSSSATVDIGTSAAGNQVLNDIVVAAGATVTTAVNTKFSESAETSLFISVPTWGSTRIITITFYMH